MGLLEFFGFGRKPCRKSSFGKKKRKTKRTKRTKKSALRGKKVMYVRSRTGRVKKIKKCHNKQGKVCWRYTDNKTVPKSVKKYSTKTAAQRKTKTKRKTKRRARFGQNGNKQDGSLGAGWQSPTTQAFKAGGGYADYYGKLQPHIQASSWWYPKSDGKLQSPQMIKGGPYQNASLRKGSVADAGYPQSY